MVRSISRALGLLGAVAVLGSWSGLSAQSASAIPDLSGVWGRNTIDYTAPATGKGPLKNISGSRNVMVGDYNDPMLKPWAAEIVKRNGEIAKTGDAFPTAHNQCWPEPPPYILGNQRHDDELQSDQRAGRPADEDVEAFPFMEFSHDGLPQIRMPGRGRQTARFCACS